MGAAIYIAIALWCGTPYPSSNSYMNPDINKGVEQCRQELIQCLDKHSYKECFSEVKGPK